jgi:chromodomain-helicase-DNA-binding protein 4
MYFGSATSRENIRNYEFYYPKEKSKKLKKKKSSSSQEQKKHSRIKFDVLLTSYEMITMDTPVLKNIEWECLVLTFLHGARLFSLSFL